MKNKLRNITEMTIKVIKTEKDYAEAMERLKTLFDAKKGTPEGNELEKLGALIEEYEKDII